MVLRQTRVYCSSDCGQAIVGSGVDAKISPTQRWEGAKAPTHLTQHTCAYTSITDQRIKKNRPFCQTSVPRVIILSKPSFYTVNLASVCFYYSFRHCNIVCAFSMHLYLVSNKYVRVYINSVCLLFSV